MPAGLIRGTTSPSVVAVKNTTCCVQVEFRFHVAVVNAFIISMVYAYFELRSPKKKTRTRFIPCVLFVIFTLSPVWLFC